MPAATLPPVDIDGVDFILDDQPDLHGVLAGLRARRDYAIVPFAGTRGVLLLTQELVAAAFRDEETFPSSAAYSITTKPVAGGAKSMVVPSAVTVEYWYSISGSQLSPLRTETDPSG
ncbi:hypothetical protein C8E89_103328 [Mycolicibacterium moriokaense]|uniref:Uncharacterized protein n=1 Tax=Mycolicibacterium moriokaense TaxID=39691 RepID=A0A318HQV5_9MYCO|nr:hypothetical protein C8E89_103328 [Mycolicibacterium moriokaense]